METFKNTICCTVPEKCISFTCDKFYLTEPEGYEFGKLWGKALVTYNYTLFPYDEPIDTYTDELAVGFMTWMPNGTIVRVDSKDTNDFIEIKLVCHALIMDGSFNFKAPACDHKVTAN